MGQGDRSAGSRPSPEPSSPATSPRELRRGLRVPADAPLPAWAGPALGRVVAEERAARRGRPLGRAVFGILDVETTGTTRARHRIVELGVVVWAGGRVRARFAREVDAEAPASVRGIARPDGRARGDLPGEAEVVRELAAFLDDEKVEALIAHNAGFDRGFVETAWREHGPARALPPFLCSLRLARRLVPGPAHDLDSLVLRLGLPRLERHRAASDAEMTAALFRELLGRARLAGVHTLEALSELASPARTARVRRVRVVDAPPEIV